MQAYDGPCHTQAKDKFYIPPGPMTRAKAKTLRERWNPKIQAFVSKELKAAQHEGEILKKLSNSKPWISSSNLLIHEEGNIQQPLDVH